MTDLERAVEAAVAQERERCVGIAQLARFGDLDNDLRTIIHMIVAGCSVAEIEAMLAPK